MRDAIRREDAAEHHPAFLDLRKIPFPENGVSAPDPYTLVIRIRGKYPQFQDWLTMSFFAPVPWEAEAFYANPGFKENSIGLAWWPVGHWSLHDDGVRRKPTSRALEESGFSLFRLPL